MNLEKITARVCDLCDKTGHYIARETNRLRSGDIEIKSPNNYVTIVDRKSQDQLIAGLSKILPGTGFIAEENPSLETGELNWIIDPLDGTTNYIHGVPVYSISVALAERNEVLLGVVLEINLHECFYTWKGASSYLNGMSIKVSESSHLSDCLFATGFPYFDFDRLDEYLSLFRYLMKNSQGVRRIGSAAADLAYVACGRFDGFYEYGLNSWDVAAGSLLVRNAKGKICDFKFCDNYLFGKEIIATNDLIFDSFKQAFRENFV